LYLQPGGFKGITFYLQVIGKAGQGDTSVAFASDYVRDFIADYYRDDIALHRRALASCDAQSQPLNLSQPIAG